MAQVNKGYALFVSLKKHFESDYDYFRYNGKIKMPVTISSPYSYQKLANMKDPQGVVVANIIDRDIKWIQDVTTSDESQQTYLLWMKRQNSLTYNFKTDLENLDENFDKNFVCENGEAPKIFTLMKRGKITKETFSILAELTNAWGYWNKTCSDGIIFKPTVFKLKKYTPFIKYDKAAMKNLVKDAFSA